MNKPVDPLRLGVVLFEGFELLDVFGPVELLSKSPHCRIMWCGPEVGPVASSQGVGVVSEIAYDDVAGAETDVLLVPGGAGTRPLARDADFLGWLAGVGAACPLVGSVCTGSALLAAAGLLDGYRATTNKKAFEWATSCGPDVEWVAEARWVRDRDRWTSSGVAAGMDMTHALMTDLLGAEDADATARAIEYEPHRDSSWDPFAKVYGLT